MEASNVRQAPLPAQMPCQRNSAQDNILGAVNFGLWSLGCSVEIGVYQELVAAMGLRGTPEFPSHIEFLCSFSHCRWPRRRLSVLTALTALRFGIVSHVSGNGLVHGLAGSAATLQVRARPGTQTPLHRVPRCARLPSVCTALLCCLGSSLPFTVCLRQEALFPSASSLGGDSGASNPSSRLGSRSRLQAEGFSSRTRYHSQLPFHS